MPIALRLLDPQAATSFTALRDVVLGAPAYSRAYDGRAPTDSDARELIASRPADCQPSQKELLAIEADGATIGCISLVRGWPAADTVHVGLLMLVEIHQGHGHGQAAWAAFEARLRGWPEARQVRIAVLAVDGRAQRFWRRLGFAPTGQALRSWLIDAELLIMSKRLAPPPSL